MNRAKLFLISSLFLLGSCASTSEVTPVAPPKPDKVISYVPTVHVIEYEGVVYVAMTYEESQLFRIWLNDLKRYMQDQKDIICYYEGCLSPQK